MFCTWTRACRKRNTVSVVEQAEAVSSSLTLAHYDYRQITPSLVIIQNTSQMLPKHVQTVRVQPFIRRPSLHLLDKTCQDFINQLSEQDLFYHCKNVTHVLHF